jgi:plasmid stability protein
MVRTVPFHNQSDTMPNITLKNVPDEVHQRLKEQAERHRRSMNREAIWILERALCPTPRDADAVIAEAEALNRDIDTEFDPSLIEKEKRREGLE